MKRNDYEGDERRENSGQWHLNKGVSVGIIVAILAQSGSSIWYGSKLDSRVQDSSTKIEELRAWREKHENAQARTESQIAVIGEKLSTQNDNIHLIIDLLEKHSAQEAQEHERHSISR